MKKLWVSLLVLVGFASVVEAAGNADAGKQKVAACAACHGEGGNSMAPTFPKLAGQNARYLLKQLKDIQCGALSAEQQKAEKCNARTIPAMAGQLDNFNDQDLADIAAYYASQKSTGGQTEPDLLAKGAEIYRAGIRSKGVAACSACHSPTGAGNSLAGYPALSGQHAEYIEAQLKAFRAAADGMPGRMNDGDTKIMRSVAANMSDSEITAVSSFASGLH